MNVRKHMSAPPITISEDTDFKSALGLMQKHRIRRLPVVDEGGVLIGIVAERDLLVAADRYLTSPVDVARIMTRQVVTVGDTTPVVDAAILMMERKIGGLPVVDPSRKLLGIITETDLLKALIAILRREEQSAQATHEACRARGTRASVPLRRTQGQADERQLNEDRKRPPAARKSARRISRR